MNDNIKYKRIKFVVAKILKPHYKSTILIAASLLFVATISTILPKLTSALIDDGLLKFQHQVVIKLSMLMFVLNLIICIVYMFCEYMRLIAYNQIRYELKNATVEKILKIQMVYFEKGNATTLFQKVDTDISVIAGVFSAEIIMSLLQVLVTFGYLIAVFNINFKLALLLLLFAPIKLAVSVAFSQKNVYFTKKANEAETEYSQLFGEIFANIRSIRNYNLQEHFCEQLKNKQRAALDLEFKKNLFDYGYLQVDSIIIQLTMSSIYIFISYLISANEISVGNFVAVQVYALSILNFVSQFFDVIYAVSTLIPSIDRYTNFMEYKEENVGKNKICNIKDYSIHMKKICFQYDNGRKLMEDLDIYFPHGTKTAIIGKNGVGKTTIFNLLTRLYQPTSGNIYIGNTDINTIELEMYRNLFSIVEQNVLLFNDTIYNNICMQKPVDNETVNQIIDIVGLTDLVKEKTLEYIIGENGCKISGGQRQRISLARALARDSKVVLLDEVTSNMDDGYTNVIKKALMHCGTDKTVICITHKEELISMMDQVIHLG